MVTTSRFYTGFVCDRARELGVVPLSKLSSISKRARKVFEGTARVIHPKYGLPRLHVNHVLLDELDALILGVPRMTTTQVSALQGTTEPEPTETPSSLVDELRMVVSTLNNMADAIAAKDREMELLRREMAMLSVAARRAMAVYGD